jgi:hypothetical protein
MNGKILTAALIIIFSCKLCTGQNLTFADIKFVIEHNVEDVDNYVAKKGFLYYKTEEDSSDCKTMEWSCDRNAHNNLASAFLIKYCFESNKGLVWYQCGNRMTFDKIKSFCISSGFKHSNTKADKLGALCTTLESIDYEIEFCSEIDEKTNLNVYTISLSRKPKPAKRITGNYIEAHQMCKITGMLKEELYYGSPNFGEDTLTDEKEYCYILHLQKPIFFMDSELGSGEWEAVYKIQILKDNVTNISDFINKKVTITCSLSTGITGHHHAPAITWVLFDIKLAE